MRKNISSFYYTPQYSTPEASPGYYYKKLCISKASSFIELKLSKRVMFYACSGFSHVNYALGNLINYRSYSVNFRKSPHSDDTSSWGSSYGTCKL